MQRFYLSMIALSLLAASAYAEARSYAVSCNGCSNSMKAGLAKTATNQGKVYVFDASRPTVTAYYVTSETLDFGTIGTWSEARPVATDNKLKTLWADFIGTQDDASDLGIIDLPPDFPIRSVAGALLDPRYASTSIENHLRFVDSFAGLSSATGSLLARAVQLNIGVLDMEKLVKHITLTIKFPDGSTIDIKIELAFNPQSGKAKPEVEFHGNALDANGEAVPYSPVGFDNRSFGGGDARSVNEWAHWARSRGIPVIDRRGGGGGGGFEMECWFTDAGVLRCVLKEATR